MAVDALQFVDSDDSSVSTLNSVVFLTSLFRYLAQFKIDDRQSDDSSAILLKVVRANVDKCDNACRSLMLVLFVTKGDDVVTTQAVVLSLQHLLLVCPETTEFVLQQQVRSHLYDPFCLQVRFVPFVKDISNLAFITDQSNKVFRLEMICCQRTNNFDLSY